MAADVIHRNIGKLFCKTNTVANFDDFVQLCEKANNNIKTIVLDLSFIYSISKKAHTRSTTNVKMSLTESIFEVQFKKGNSMLRYKESFLAESYTTVNFLRSSFLKKGGLKTLLASSNECRRIKQSKHDNIVNMLKGVPQSAHSLWNRIYYNSICPNLCCSRDVFEEGECQTNCK